jgi:hypothetical protein
MIKFGIKDRIKAKIYGTGWMIKYFRNDIKQSKSYIRQENELLNDTRKLGHLPEGVSQNDVRFAKVDKKYLKEVIKSDKEELSKWERIRNMMKKRKLEKVM